MDSFESTVLKKYRRLSQFLIVSSLLNVAFVSSAIYQYFKPAKPLEWVSLKGDLNENSENVLKNFLTLSYQDLVQKLSLKNAVEPGLAKRDLALAVLAQSFHVDVARALNKPQLHFQYLSYHEGQKQKAIGIPRGLTDVDFEIVSQFLKQEAWPLTAKGLFLKMKLGIKDELLNQALYSSLEFSRLYDGLKIAVPSLKKEALVFMLLKGDASDFENFEQACLSARFNPDQFLAHYMNLGSSTAALHLVDQPTFSVKNLSDKQALELLDQLRISPDRQKLLAKQLLTSFRPDSFKDEVTKRGFVKEQEPLVALIEAPKIEPKPILEPKLVKEPIKTKTSKTYVVQEGDSLWKIARKFKVDVEALKAKNQLDSESLKPGKVLQIP